jgi:hypothetical protein
MGSSQYRAASDAPACAAVHSLLVISGRPGVSEAAAEQAGGGLWGLTAGGEQMCCSTDYCSMEFRIEHWLHTALMSLDQETCRLLAMTSRRTYATWHVELAYEAQWSDAVPHVTLWRVPVAPAGCVHGGAEPVPGPPVPCDHMPHMQSAIRGQQSGGGVLRAVAAGAADAIPPPEPGEGLAILLFTCSTCFTTHCGSMWYRQLPRCPWACFTRPCSMLYTSLQADSCCMCYMSSVWCA